MSFDEEQQRRTRVVVETPTSRREVVQQQVTRFPEKKGISTGVVAAVALTAVALTALLFLFLSNRGDATNSNLNIAVQPTPALAATPLPTPFVQPTFQELPPMSTSIPPVMIPSGPAVIEIPTTTTTDPLANATPAPTPDDGALQSQIRNRIIADKELAAADVTVNVTNGTATLTGTVKSADSRRRASKLATLKGVKTVDNQLTVAAPAPTAAPPASAPPPPTAPTEPADDPPTEL